MFSQPFILFFVYFVTCIYHLITQCINVGIFEIYFIGCYCSWCQVEITSTWNPHTPCINGYVKTETYPRLE